MTIVPSCTKAPVNDLRWGSIRDLRESRNRVHSHGRSLPGIVLSSCKHSVRAFLEPRKLTNTSRSGEGFFNEARTSIHMAVSAVIMWEVLSWTLGLSASVVPFLESSFAPICHHEVARTLRLGSSYGPVCARCTGLWLGWLSVVPLLRRRAPCQGAPRRLSAFYSAIYFGAVISVLLAFGEHFRFFSTNNLWRTALALPLGAAASFFLHGGPASMRKELTE